MAEDLEDEFKKFLSNEREKFLLLQIDRALQILKSAHPFLETWYKSSKPGTGQGAKRVLDLINKYIQDFE